MTDDSDVSDTLVEPAAGPEAASVASESSTLPPMPLASTLHYEQASIEGLSLADVCVVQIVDRTVVVPVPVALAQRCGFQVVAVDPEILLSIGVLPVRENDPIPPRHVLPTAARGSGLSTAFGVQTGVPAPENDLYRGIGGVLSAAPRAVSSIDGAIEATVLDEDQQARSELGPAALAGPARIEIVVESDTSDVAAPITDLLARLSGELAPASRPLEVAVEFASLDAEVASTDDSGPLESIDSPVDAARPFALPSASRIDAGTVTDVSWPDVERRFNDRSETTEQDRSEGEREPAFVAMVNVFAHVRKEASFQAVDATDRVVRNSALHPGLLSPFGDVEAEFDVPDSENGLAFEGGPDFENRFATDFSGQDFGQPPDRNEPIENSGGGIVPVWNSSKVTTPTTPIEVDTVLPITFDVTRPLDPVLTNLFDPKTNDGGANGPIDALANDVPANYLPANNVPANDLLADAPTDTAADTAADTEADTEAAAVPLELPAFDLFLLEPMPSGFFSDYTRDRPAAESTLPDVSAPPHEPLPPLWPEVPSEVIVVPRAIRTVDSSVVVAGDLVSLGEFFAEHGSITSVLVMTSVEAEALCLALGGAVPLAGGSLVRDGSPFSLSPDSQQLRGAAGIGVLSNLDCLVPDLLVIENVELPLLIAGETPETARMEASATLEDLDLDALTSMATSALSKIELVQVGIVRTLLSDEVAVFGDITNGIADPELERIADLLAVGAEAGHAVVVITTSRKLVAALPMASRFWRLHNGVVQAVSRS